MSKERANRRETRTRLHKRLRSKITGTTERPRLSVYFSGQHIYAQIIDDLKQKTLLGAFSTEKGLKSKTIRANVSGAAEIGKLIAERAKEKGILDVVFDRGGFRYHGKVKALADAAREGGLRF